MRPLRAVWIAVWMVAGGVIAGLALPSVMEATYRLLSNVADRAAEDIPSFRVPFTLGATFLFGAIILGLVGTYTAAKMEEWIFRWEHMESGDKITLFVGVLIGVLLSIPFHLVAFFFGPVFVIGSFLFMMILVAFSIAIMRSMQDAMPWNAGAARKGNTKIFDTNVIIDGRIYEVCKAGFLDGKFYIPQFVLTELQVIADSHDPNRRQRGRRGLDMLKHLQGSFSVDIGTQDRLAGDVSDPVDQRLVTLAQALGAPLVTNDFNLNKVAQVQGVSVLNINDLAMAMRPVVLPGDTMSVEIERVGSQSGQGVGYVEDGTMVIIEHGEYHIGERIDVHVTQIHQSAAGRMIFATIEGSAEGRSRRRLR
ncbi:MAG: TRAM domain-containing protein [Armatimonadetes bacterium]|nr:TRAM domain-containing protein [Armatimonadota bacterium]